jgi:hypothetical protein
MLPALYSQVYPRQLHNQDKTAAQQKTVKACQEAWQANKASNEAVGITEKCRASLVRRAGFTIPVERHHRR